MKTMIKFLLLILVISPMSICAEKDMMINECHNADVPAICMQCLESDPNSIHADHIGIAGIVINCLESHLHIITNNITNLSSKKDKGEVKTALEICKKDLSTNASTILSEAKTSLKTGDYDKTNKSIKLALGFPLRCMFNLKRVKFTSPQLFSQINIYAQLSDAAMRIIDRF
ncbi:Plant invertase/pectin methylesterase inhibitor superfamily protein [Arabidopsis thaliana]|uniref:Plant invertase/pectin methylesterase inhibitor superfamily protein n=1 Tax=Arabidopsis thaliana TaxID=3702 RepID=F4JHP1_ARATH|nr:Plant invertase/pectin methylesterase inhibitor superfamily protein [Arabidopsis thaliana]AEE81948.2 Plant invertase/pectin methylesterase inhibitor superfamily protein [Arabidopsis thaliana]|eukprot:NP_001319835.1 Plant invertase/pectin methylesterase inhibitor superfamily protein [Arabidopsis thaliana]